MHDDDDNLNVSRLVWNETVKLNSRQFLMVTHKINTYAPCFSFDLIQGRVNFENVCLSYDQKNLKRCHCTF